MTTLTIEDFPAFQQARSAITEADFARLQDAVENNSRLFLWNQPSARSTERLQAAGLVRHEGGNMFKPTQTGRQLAKLDAYIAAYERGVADTVKAEGTFTYDDPDFQQAYVAGQEFARDELHCRECEDDDDRDLTDAMAGMSHGPGLLDFAEVDVVIEPGDGNAIQARIVRINGLTVHDLVGRSWQAGNMADAMHKLRKDWHFATTTTFNVVEGACTYCGDVSPNHTPSCPANG